MFFLPSPNSLSAKYGKQLKRRHQIEHARAVGLLQGAHGVFAIAHEHYALRAKDSSDATTPDAKAVSRDAPLVSGQLSDEVPIAVANVHADRIQTLAFRRQVLILCCSSAFWRNSAESSS